MKHVTTFVWTFSLSQSVFGTSTKVSSLTFASLIGRGLCTCYLFWRPFWHAIGCPSYYGRCPMEHPLSSVCLSTALSEHPNEYFECRLEHSSKYSSHPERCCLGQIRIFKSMQTSLCTTTDIVISDVSLDVLTVCVDCNGVMLDVWINVWDDLKDTTLNIPAFQWACAVNAADVHYNAFNNITLNK